MKENKKIIISIIAVLLIIVAVITGTYAYWKWNTTSSQQTEVTFTVGQGFSCSADGGGDITSNTIQLAPAACTNTNYAIKRTVTVSPTISDGNPITLNMWLEVKSIDAGLTANNNFKYALTTSATSCTTATVVASGNFNGATVGTKKNLLANKNYTATTNDTYYLWVWLDSAETSSASQNQTFHLVLGGECTNQN